MSMAAPACFASPALATAGACEAEACDAFVEAAMCADGAAASQAPAVASAHEAKHAGAAIDIDKIANEVYRQILVLMDAARSRNGEPYL